MSNKPKHTDYKQKFEECDDKFETIFRLTSVASKIINSDLTILKVNKALTELLGFSAEEIEGTEILDYACEEFKKHWHDLQDELWSKKSPFFKLDVCLIKKDKTLVWVNVTTVLFNEDGVTYGYSVLDDITGKKHFEESERRLNLALQYSKMAAWEMNLDDHSVIRSQNHDQIFGYKNPIGQWSLEHYLKHLLPDDSLGFQEAIQALSHQGLLDFKGRIHTDNMSFKVVHFQGEAEFNEHGKAGKIIGTVKDITKEKILERQKEDFISIASHELKTPITSLNASLQLINKKLSSQDEKIQELVNMANKSMTKVSGLVEDLLSATSMSKGQMHLSKSNFNLSQLIADCCDHIRYGDKFSIKTYGDLNLTVHADAERIEQVITNLVNNAVKYAPDSEEVNVHIKKLNHKVKISVIDNGPGVSPEKLDHLFDRFYRVESSGSRYSGLGLGLYISSEIIKMHGGEIGVNSEVGKGSTFWFTLPLE